MTEEKKADRLLELEAGIIEDNHGSWHHVNGCYYANLDDAARQRRWAAEKMLRHEIRLEGICAWCDKLFEEGEEKMPAAGRYIHVGKCTDEFNELCTSVGGVELPPDELRGYAQWADGLTDSEVDAAFAESCGTVERRSA